MINLTELNYPIEPHPTWNIIDSSKLQCFMSCPRRYFYEYILGWRPEGSNIHTVFGTAWHAMMEQLYQVGYNKNGIAAGYEKFLQIYRAHFDEDEDALFEAKNPNIALAAAKKYIEQYVDDELTVYGTEIAGKVRITPHYEMYFKMDLITQDSRGRFYVWDHKTTGWELNAVWMNQWGNRGQFKLYLHALATYLHARGEDPSKIYGLIVNGAQFRVLKAGPKLNFARHIISYDPAIQAAWARETGQWLRFLIHQHRLLAKTSVDRPVMAAFPKNGTGEACTRWNRTCYLHDLCMTVPNPLQIEKPSDFKVEYWNPMEVETIRERVDL